MKVITTHRGSDFDALASLVAATLLYEDSVGVLPTTINANLKTFLAIHKDVFHLLSPKEIDLEKVDSLVVVDTHSWDRLDPYFNELKQRQDLEIIIWDHHLKGTIKSTQSHVREMGSTTTMIVEKLKEKQTPISPIQATLFLMGIYEDTGSLSFNSTLPEDAYAAGYLLSLQADLGIATSFLKQAYGSRQKELLHDMLEVVVREELNGVTIGFAIQEITGRIQNLAMVVQMYREIINVDVAFGLFHDVENDQCMVIGRSAVESVNVGRIMRSMGGGGHPGAGSTLIKKAKPSAVKETIMELAGGNQSSSIALADIMSYPVTTVQEKTSMEEVAKVLRKVGCTGLPVVDEKDSIVGVISRRDFKRISRDNQMQSPVKAFMSRNPVVMEHDKSATEVIQLMIQKDIGRIPIIQDGKLIGIVTRSDVMTYFYDLLPD